MPFKQMLPINNVVANQTATLDMLGNVAGKVIKRMILQLGGTFTKAQMSAIRIRASDSEAGGKLIFDSSGSNVDSRMQYRGIAASATFLSVDFTEIRAKTIIGQNVGAIDTRNLKALRAEIDIGAATSPTLVAWADYDEPVDYDRLYPNPAERALIGKVLRQVYTFSAAGTFAVPLPYGRQGGSLIKRIHYFGSTVTGAEVRKNSLVVHQSTDAVNDFQQTEFTRTPQASIYHVDFIPDGNQGNALNAADAASMEYYITVSGTGNVTAEMELLDPLGNN